MPSTGAGKTRRTAGAHSIEQTTGATNEYETRECCCIQSCMNQLRCRAATARVLSTWTYKDRQKRIEAAELGLLTSAELKHKCARLELQSAATIVADTAPFLCHDAFQTAHPITRCACNRAPTCFDHSSARAQACGREISKLVWWEFWMCKPCSRLNCKSSTSFKLGELILTFRCSAKDQLSL